MKKKLQLIDLVRTFCILSVMAQHLGTLYRPEGQTWEPRLWESFASKGAYGVSLFFVVSGFLITRLIDLNLGGLSKPRLKAFYVRRLARIVPLLLLVVMVGVFFLWILPDAGKTDMTFRGSQVSFDFVFFLSILTFTFNWLVVFKEFIFHQSFYGLYWVVLWWLSIEEQFYLAYPLVLKYFKPRPWLPLCLVLAVALGLASRWLVYLNDPENFHLGLFNSFSGFEEIAVGITLYLASKKYQKVLSENKTNAWLAFGSGTLLFIFIYARVIRPEDFIWEPTLLAGAFFLLVLGGLSLEFFDSLWLKPFAYPGKISYGMYLWHSLILFLFGSFIYRFNTYFSFAVFICLALILSSLSYYLFELPMNRWIRKWAEKVW
jgi:peptidoglycan/LPS O-acetylase OafA/YrhL